MLVNELQSNSIHIFSSYFLFFYEHCLLIFAGLKKTFGF